MKSILIPMIAVALVFPPIVRAQNTPPRPAPLVSPEIQTDARVTFRLRAAKATEVVLRGQWAKQPLPLTRSDDGVWSLTTEPIPAGVWEYSFQVDGLNLLDPRNPTSKPQRELSKSILHIAGSPPNPWDWQDVPHGTVHQHSYRSQALGRTRDRQE